jgi:hypothetical protein
VKYAVVFVRGAVWHGAYWPEIGLYTTYRCLL